MRYLLIAAALIGLCGASTSAEAYVRCMGTQPICRPGTHAMCICESDISLNCAWICGGQ